jgi:hypothetical protein
MGWTIGTTQESQADAPAAAAGGLPWATIALLGAVAGVVAHLLGVTGALGAACLWVGAISVGSGFSGYRAARPPSGGPLFAIDRITEGPVEVVGRVVPPSKALLSPLTSTKCSFFDYKIWLEDEGTGERTLVEERRKLTNFWMKDVTGSIWVEAEGIDINVPKQLDEDLRTYDQTPRAVGERLHKLGVDPFISPGVRRAIFFEETRLDPGDNMLVKGVARRGEGGQLVIAQGGSEFSVERWTRPTFVAHVSAGARLRLWLGVALLLGGVTSLLT